MCDTSGGHIPDVASKSSLSLFHPSDPASQLRGNHHPEFCVYYLSDGKNAFTTYVCTPEQYVKFAGF